MNGVRRTVPAAAGVARRAAAGALNGGSGSGRGRPLGAR